MPEYNCSICPYHIECDKRFLKTDLHECLWESIENDIEEENNSKNENELTVKVKHLIQYLQTEFDPESEVRLDKDGFDYDDPDIKNEIDLIKNSGVFENFDGDLFINN